MRGRGSEGSRAVAFRRGSSPDLERLVDPEDVFELEFVHDLVAEAATALDVVRDPLHESGIRQRRGGADDRRRRHTGKRDCRDQCREHTFLSAAKNDGIQKKAS